MHEFAPLDALSASPKPAGSFSTQNFETLLTPEDTAQLLDLHPVTLLRWAREGRVPHHRLGRKIRFRASELNSWLATGYTDTAVRAA
jgi:excisionase family DNA binding protein